MRTGFGNNVKGALASDISALQTSIPVMPGTGALFAQTLEVESALENASYPTQAGQIYAKLTICDEQETVFEIVHLMSVSGDNLKVIRGQEGTSARSWYLADTISNFATRGSEVGFVQVEELQSGKYQAFAAGGTANALTVAIPSTFYLNGGNTFALRLPLVIFPQLANTGPVTLQLTVSGQVIGTFPIVKGGSLPLSTGDIAPGMPFIVTYAAGKSTFVMSGSASADIGVDEWRHYFAPGWSTEYAPYIRGMVVRYSNTYWVSLVNGNSAVPGTDASKWQTFTFERASNAEAVAGTATDKIITPPSLQYALSAIDFAPPWSATFAPYINGAVVRLGGTFWLSLVNNNTATPGADSSKWQTFPYQTASGGMINIQKITQSGTVTLSSKTKMIVVELQAPGGGRPSPTMPAGKMYFSCGGGGGAYAKFKVQVESGDTFSVVIGSSDGSATPSDTQFKMNGAVIVNCKQGGMGGSDAVPFDSQNNFTWSGGGAAWGGEATFSYSTNRIFALESVAGGNGEKAGFSFYTTNGFSGGAYWGGRGGYAALGSPTSLEDGAGVLPVPNKYGSYGAGCAGYIASYAQVSPPASVSGQPGVCIIMEYADDAATPAPDPTPYPYDIIVSPSVLNVGAGTSGTVTAAVQPAEIASSYPVTWSTSDSGIISVTSGGNWTANAAGTAVLTASISTGITESIPVVVSSNLTALTIAYSSPMTVGGTQFPTMTKTPAGASENITFSSSNSSVLQVDSGGGIVAVAVGSATITATGALSGVTASQAVAVVQAPSLTYGRLLNIIVMTSSGTYTPSAGVARVIFEVQGGGGNQSAVALLSDSTKTTYLPATGAGGYLMAMTSNPVSLSVQVGAPGYASLVNSGDYSIYLFADGGNGGIKTTQTTPTEMFINPGGTGGDASVKGMTALRVIKGMNGLAYCPNGWINNGGAAVVGAAGGNSPLGGWGDAGNSKAAGWGGGLDATSCGGTYSLAAASGGAGVVIIWEYAS